MFEKITKYEKVEYEVLKSIKCDVCQVNILKNKQDCDKICVATIIYSKCNIEDVRSGSFENAFERESTDLCNKCYMKIVSILRKMGGKIPSYWSTLEKDETEEV